MPERKAKALALPVALALVTLALAITASAKTTTAKPKPTPTPKATTWTAAQIQALLAKTLDADIAAGRFIGPPGPQGPQGPAGASISTYPANPSANSNGGSIAGFSQLSASNLTVDQATSTKTLNVDQAIATKGLTVSGNTTTASLAITGLTNQNCLGTNASGVVGAGTCGGGGSVSLPGIQDAVLTDNGGGGIGGNANFVANFTPLPVPAAPTLTKVGAGTGTTWGYKVVAGLIGASPVALGSAPSSEQTIDGNATLDGTHSITVAGPTCANGVTSYDVYRTTAGGTPSTTGLIGNVACSTTLSDTGLPVIRPFTFPSPSDYSIGAGSSIPYVNTSLGSSFGCASIANNDVSFPFQDAGTGLSVVNRMSCPGFDYASLFVDTLVDKPSSSSIGIQVDTEQQVDSSNQQLAMSTTFNDNGFNSYAAGGISTQMSFSGTAYPTPSTYQGNYLGSLYVSSTGNVTKATIFTPVQITVSAGGVLGTIYDYQAIPAQGVVTTDVGYYGADMGAGGATNKYYSWFDSRGVGRCKEDNTFNGVGQSICVVYNPQFTKYTPGATDFERIVYGQWNSNVAEIGPQAGGTGTLRPLRLLGSQLDIPNHLNTASSNNDFDGQISISSATSASHNFATAFNSVPACTLTPTADPNATGRYWVTTTTGGVTANVSSSGSITFNYHCVGNPN